ncbi:MAG: autotransporter domain-containing protein [Proteobacteria bacterium]|nr:autotransporter domain-containing protein [Pseudomonadota bacterium]
MTTDTSNTDAARGTSSDRVQLFNSGGDVSATITGGATIGGYGLRVATGQLGAGITFNNNGSVNQATAAVATGAVQLTADTGPLIYNSASGATVTGVGNSALQLKTAGDITAHVNGDIVNTNSSGSSSGVQIEVSGNTLLDGAGNISGAQGVNAAITGSGDFTLGGSGNITFTSDYGIGVNKYSNPGTVTINRTGTITGPGAGGGNNKGISVQGAVGDVFVTGVGAISGVGVGIDIASEGNLMVTPGGAITAADSGISAATANNGAGSVTTTSAYDVTAGNRGITAATVSGAATINLTGGTVTTTNNGGIGLYAFSTVGGTTRINMSGGLVQVGGAGIGLFARAEGGGNAIVDQTGGSIGVAGTPVVGNGIIAGVDANGGNASVTAGPVYATADAIIVNNAGPGTIDVTTNATVHSTTGSAVVAQTSAGGATTITNNGTLSGAAAVGVVSATSGGGSIGITNNAGGAIGSNQSAPETRVAIATSGGATTLVNNGTLTGRLSLANAANSISNSGTWTSNGANTLGTVSTTLTNTGAMTLGSGGTITGTNVSIVNSAGTLRNDGTINADVTVNGGTLTGGGTVVGATTIGNGSTLAPLTSASTFNVGGNLTFAAGSTYAIRVSPGSAGRTVATGTANLTGGRVSATYQPGTYLNRSYTILTSTGLGGTSFAGLTNNSLPAGVTASLGYTANDVLLNLVATLGTLPGSGLSNNQQNIANTLNNYFNAGGALPPGFVNLFGLTGSALNSGLDQISGEQATGAPTAAFQSMNQFLGAMLNPFSTGDRAPANVGIARGFASEAVVNKKAARAYAAMTPKDARADEVDRRWGVWGGAYGASGQINGDPARGAHDLSARTYGVIAGADYRATPDTVFGFAMSGGGANWGLSDGLGSGRSDVFQIGAYATHKFGAAYVSAALGYAWHSTTTERTVTVSGRDQLNADFNAHSIGARFEGGYRLSMNPFNVTPYAAYQAQAFYSPSYGETATSGSSQFALSYGSKTISSNRVELGAWVDRSIALTPDKDLQLRARAAWAHDWNGDRTINAAFQSLPGAGFAVSGAMPGADALLVSFGGGLNFANGWSILASYEGEFAQGASTSAGRGTLRYQW